MKEKFEFYHRRFKALPPFSQFLLFFALCVFLVFFSDLALNTFVFKKSQETGFVPRLSPQPLPSISLASTATISAQGKIAFAKGRKAWVLDLDTRESKQVEEQELWIGNKFVWSPDGRYLAWQTLFHGAPLPVLYIWDSTDEKLREVKIDLDQDKYGYFELVDYDWSPVENEIVLAINAYTLKEQKKYFIKRYKAPDFVAVGSILEREGELEKIKWSEPGRIIFLADDELFSVDLNQPEVRPLYLLSLVYFYDVSADGKTLVYPAPFADKTRLQLWIYDLVEGKKKMLYSTIDPCQEIENDSVKFAPDGQTVAFVEHCIDYFAVHLHRTDSGEMVSLIEDSTSFNWSPDGNLLVTVDIYKFEEIYLALHRLDGALLEKLGSVDEGGAELAWSSQ